MNELITDEVMLIERYIRKTWKQMGTVKEVRLRDIFKEPENKGLKHIWKYGSADLLVYHRDRLVAIIEPGGSHHFTDEKQIKNDRRKWKLCDINGVRDLKIANGVFDRLSGRQKRRLLGRYIFGMR